MRKWIPITGLLFTILVLSYLESPYSFINKDHAQVTSIPNEVLLAEAQKENHPASQEQESKETSSNENAAEDEEVAQNYSLEMVFESKSKKDGYIVETYREYQFYRDENGQVIKKVPTSNYNYLRYYDK
ncbi:hypothetical protein [Bacillus benzoevorans]|uniref:Uncharacterized protein n=1 Tax=Bacillus benzoevorans TaxID=1456 RepID=A0A7X0LY09_9BACI|nr:hypothetical protein [Bacillus benzoevorans]MBB6446969.1 hypothetical protein [Bacillus benzoevorans]